MFVRLPSAALSLLFGMFAPFVLAQAPVITQQPQPRNVPRGDPVSFDVAVHPAAPNVRFQWRLNGNSLTDATNQSLSLSNAQAGDGGLYSVAAYNGFGSDNSLPAELRFNDIPFAPFSNFFSNSVSTSAANGLVQGTNQGATAEPNEPAHHGKPAQRSVWMTWVAQAPGLVTFQTTGSGFDTVLAAYLGTSLGQLATVRSDDDRAGFFASQISFRVQPNTAYRIAVDGFGGAQGRFTLGWNFEATTDHLPLFSLEPVDRTVAPGTDVDFFVAGISNYTYQWYFNGQPLLNQTASNLNVKFPGPAEVGTYFCRVTGGNRFRDTREARLQFNSNSSGPPDAKALATDKLFDSRFRADNFAGQGKDAPAKSVAHGFSGTQIFSTFGSSKELGEPNHCGVAGGASEWFVFQADTNGTLHLNTDGSSLDTVLAAYVGPGVDFLTLTNVACDNNNGLDGKDSRTSLAATTGTIYWIAVDGVNNPTNGRPARGSIVLNYRLVQPLRLSSTVYTNTGGGKLTLKVTGTPNLAATIQAATNLSTTNWVSLFTNTTASGIFNYTNSGAGAHSHRFFRAIHRL